MEETGQAQPAQPMDVQAALTQYMKVELGEDKPRDEQGRFAPKQAEAPQAEAKPETEAPVEEEQKPAEETTQEPPQPAKFKLRVKAESGEDEELEVDEEELKRGYMKAKDYSHKTAALKRERESVQAEVKKAIEAKHREYAEKLQLAEQAIWHTLAPEIQNTDWNKLSRENPAEWAARYQQVQNVNARLAQIQAERRRLAEASEQEAKSAFAKQVQEANDTLKTEIPGWNQDLYGKILKAGVDHGFKSEEVNAITDPRAIKVLWKAMLYDAAQKAKPAVEKKVVPAAPKVVKPGAGEKADDPSADKWKSGIDGFKKGGGKWNSPEAIGLAMQLLDTK